MNYKIEIRIQPIIKFLINRYVNNKFLFKNLENIYNVKKGREN